MKSLAFCLFTIFCSGLLGLIPSSVFAFAVSPSVIEMEGTRGEKVHKTISIINTGSAEQTYYLDTLFFEPKEEEGIPVFDPQKKSPLSDWILLPENPIVVEPNSFKEIEVSFLIPQQSASGTFFVALTVSPAKEEIFSEGASVEAKTAVLFFLTVLGETKEQMALLDFSADKIVSSLGPEMFSFRVQNQGNVLLVPTGKIILRNVFGKEVAVLPVNEEQGRLLPGKTRKYEEKWKTYEQQSVMQKVKEEWKNFHLGPYGAELSLSFSGTEITKSIRVWILPWHACLSLVALLVVLFVFHRGYVFFLKKQLQKK